MLKARSIKEQIDKLYFIKIKYWSSKDTVSRVKGQPIQIRRKYSQKHVSGKELVTRIYKNSQNSVIRQHNFIF